MNFIIACVLVAGVLSASIGDFAKVSTDKTLEVICGKNFVFGDEDADGLTKIYIYDAKGEKVADGDVGPNMFCVGEAIYGFEVEISDSVTTYTFTSYDIKLTKGDTTKVTSKKDQGMMLVGVTADIDLIFYTGDGTDTFFGVYSIDGEEYYSTNIDEFDGVIGGMSADKNGAYVITLDDVALTWYSVDKEGKKTETVVVVKDVTELDHDFMGVIFYQNLVDVLMTNEDGDTLWVQAYKGSEKSGDLVEIKDYQDVINVAQYKDAGVLMFMAAADDGTYSGNFRLDDLKLSGSYKEGAADKLELPKGDFDAVEFGGVEEVFAVIAMKAGDSDIEYQYAFGTMGSNMMLYVIIGAVVVVVAAVVIFFMMKK